MSPLRKGTSLEYKFAIEFNSQQHKYRAVRRSYSNGRLQATYAGGPPHKDKKDAEHDLEHMKELWAKGERTEFEKSYRP